MSFYKPSFNQFVIGSELQLALCQLPANALFNVIDIAHYKYNSSVFNL